MFLLLFDAVGAGGNCCFLLARVLFSVPSPIVFVFLVVAYFFIGVVSVGAAHHVFFDAIVFFVICFLWWKWHVFVSSFAAFFVQSGHVPMRSRGCKLSCV